MMTRNSKPPSSIDVAKLAGVSQSAVSRTYTPGASVSPATRAKVEAAALALNYRPSLIPRIMQTHQSNIVAVVIGSFRFPFFTVALQAFSSALRTAGKHVMLVEVEDDLAMDGIVNSLAGYQVDAVVTPLAIGSQAIADALAVYRIPVVTLNSGFTNDWVRNVASDNEGAGRTAARLLHARGGRRFAYVRGPSASLAQRLRERGFVSELATLGVPDVLTDVGTYEHAGGLLAGNRLLSRADPPDAVFCANDLTAFGVIDAARARGIGVPTALCCIGYDNDPVGAWPAYDLTTFDQNADTMVASALSVAGLLPQCETRPNSIVPPLLIERGSTARTRREMR